MNILVTGASGFIGSATIRFLKNQGMSVCPVFRSASAAQRASLDYGNAAIVSSLTTNSDWSVFLKGVQAVVHCAGIAHVPKEAVPDSMIEYKEVNVNGTVNLARQAASTGVRRFVFISSIGVNGSQTFGKPFTAGDTPNPQEAYSQSKWDAEQALQCVAVETGLELVIIRPPLVYGYGAPGSFGRLISAVKLGKWLPLGSVHNRRTFVAVDNLVSFISTCVEHPRAAGEVFLVGDAEDISTTELLRRIGIAMGTPVKLFPLPVSLMLAGAALFGKSGVVKKVCGDLQVDIAKNREVLGWHPPVSLDEGLRRAVRGDT